MGETGDRGRYYEVLGVNPHTPYRQIKNAYEELMRKWDPDKWDRSNPAVEKLHKMAVQKRIEVRQAYSAITENAPSSLDYEENTPRRQSHNPASLAGPARADKPSRWSGILLIAIGIVSATICHGAIRGLVRSRSLWTGIIFYWFITGGLVLWAWNRGWKAWALLPTGIVLFIETVLFVTRVEQAVVYLFLTIFHWAALAVLIIFKRKASSL